MKFEVPEKHFPKGIFVVLNLMNNSGIDVCEIALNQLLFTTYFWCEPKNLLMKLIEGYKILWTMISVCPYDM